MIKQLILSSAVALTVVFSASAFLPEPDSDIKRECFNLYNTYKEIENCIVSKKNSEDFSRLLQEWEHRDESAWITIDISKWGADSQTLSSDMEESTPEPLTFWEYLLGYSIIFGIVFWFNRRKLVPWVLEKTKDIRRF